MRTRQDMQQQREQIEVMLEMMDLIQELIERHYGDKAKAMMYAFEESLRFFDNFGCLSLNSMEKSAGVVKEETTSSSES